MLSIVRISDYHEFRNYKERWDDLLSRSDTDNIFLTYDWIDACIRHFFNKEVLLILNIFYEDRLIGIAPLMIKRGRYLGLPVRTLCFIGTGISDRMDFIVEGNKGEAAVSIMDYLMSIKSEWDFINMEEMLDGTDTIRAIESYIAERSITNIFGPSKKAFFIAMDRAKGKISQRFSKKFHTKLKKINNKWQGLNLTFERYAGSGTSGEKLFSVFHDIENKSWKGDRQSGIFSKPVSSNFHREILSKFSKDGCLDLSVLNLNERPIAYIYNYLYGKRSYNYSIAYDKKHFNISPGTLLMLWALSDSSARDIVEFDFARGEGEWKARFARDFRLHNRVRIFKKAPYSRLLYYLQSRFMPYMRRKRYIYNLWMKLKGWLGWF